MIYFYKLKKSNLVTLKKQIVKLSEVQQILSYLATFNKLQPHAPLKDKLLSHIRLILLVLITELTVHTYIYVL